MFLRLRRYHELIIWSTALVLLYLMPFGSDVSLCPVKPLGSPYCPGCGIGNAINAALHLRFTESISMHPMGIAATIILLHRILILFKKSFLNQQPHDQRHSSYPYSLLP
ncbi:MAG: DUF2752 domain-containing protein [Chitinophagaceae bacterium]|nr:DUF2752 domain-containing protein [Chitinophagaceae bacterium]